MHIKRFLTSFLATTLTCTYLGAQDYWCLNKYITFYGDYGYIRRQGGRNLRLVEEDILPINGSSPKKVLSTEDLVDRLNWESAIRAKLVYHSNECASLEALYTYFFPWKAHKTVVGDGSLRFPFRDPDIGIDFNTANSVEAKYKTFLQNGEFNYWRHVTPQQVDYFSFSWNMGFRVIYLEEEMDLLFTRMMNSSLYMVETENVLYGAQLGAMLQINPSCCWTWTFIVKGAGFFNTAENHLNIFDENNSGELFEYKKKRWTDSYLLEGYGQLAYHWNSFLSFHFAYQGYILTGVALAANQRDIRLNRRRINVKGQIIVDGLYAGLSLSF